MNDILFQSLSLIYIALSKTAVVWIPLLLAIFAWRFWIDYVNAAAIENMKWVMLEIRIPKKLLNTKGNGACAHQCASPDRWCW